MKNSDIDKDQILITLKMNYKGEEWALGSYAFSDTWATIEDVERDIEKAIIRCSRGMGGAIRRDDVMRNLLGDVE